MNPRSLQTPPLPPPVLTLNDPVCKDNSHCSYKNIFYCFTSVGAYFSGFVIVSVLIKGLAFFVSFSFKKKKLNGTNASEVP